VPAAPIARAIDLRRSLTRPPSSQFGPGTHGLRGRLPPDVAGSATERQFEALVENIPGIVAYMDIVQVDDPAHSIPHYISPQIEDMLGYPREAWLTDDELWLQVLHPDDAERMMRADERARSTLSSLFAEYRMIGRDGRVVWVSEKAAVVQDPADGTLFWQGVMVDITERKRTEEALETSERQFRSIFDAAAIGVMTLDLDGRILEANPTLEQVCDYVAGALHGRPLRDYLEASETSGIELLGELAAGDRDRCHLEHRFRRNDGSLMWCRTVMALVRDGAGRPAHITAMLEDISARKQAEAELVHQTLHDPLTELPNRQRFLDRLEETRALRLAHGSGLGVAFMDMDGFKEVNDSLGHHAGDELLIAVACRLRAAVRPPDILARFAGDEFLVLADDLRSLDDLTQLAQRLMTCMEAPFLIAARMLRVTASIGVAYSSDAQDPAEDMLRKADAAMYLAKERGRNRVEVFGQLQGAHAAA
jgi:diguanylate cyclase (GGDEF)-like protein/PAS domain S-box-containing protein